MSLLNLLAPMLGSSETLRNAFSESFAVQPDPEVDPVKALNRAELVALDDGSGRALFDVERHRAVLGAEYVVGAPMSAFETYWMRFAFDPATGLRVELPQARASIYNVFPYSLAAEWSYGYSFSFEPDGEGCWVARETEYETSGTVCSEEEANAFGRSAARAVDVLDYFEIVLGKEIAAGLAHEAETTSEFLGDLLAAAAVEAWHRASREPF